MKNALIIFAIFILAISVRFISMDSGHIIESDEIEHDRLGLSLAEGKGYVSTDGKPTAFRPPFYAVFLAMVYKVFGHSYAAIRIIQIFLSSATVVFFYIIALKLFGRPAALLTGVLASIYMPFVVSSMLLYNETLFNFLLALICVIVVSAGTELGFLRAVSLGLLAALLTITKSTGILMPAILVITYYLNIPFASKARNRFMVNAIAMALVFCSILAPWTARNYHLFGKMIPVSTNAGINMYVGIRPVDGKIFGLGPRDDIKNRADLIENEADRSAFYTRQAIKAYVEDPVRAIKLTFMRMLFFFNFIDWEIMGGGVINYHFIFFIPFAIAGMVVSAMKRRDAIFLVFVCGLFTSMVMIFQATPRYRLPIDGYLIIFASAVICDLVMRKRYGKIFAASISVYFIFTWALYVFPYWTKDIARTLMQRAGLW